MARKQKDTKPEPVSPVSSGTVHLPTARPRGRADMAGPQGVRAVRVARDPRTQGPRHQTAAMFGGAPFGVWAADQSVPVTETRPAGGWADLHAKFLARPVHGHRRGPAGGTHRR